MREVLGHQDVLRGTVKGLGHVVLGLRHPVVRDVVVEGLGQQVHEVPGLRHRLDVLTGDVEGLGQLVHVVLGLSRPVSVLREGAVGLGQHVHDVDGLRELLDVQAGEVEGLVQQVHAGAVLHGCRDIDVGVKGLGQQVHVVIALGLRLGVVDGISGAVVVQGLLLGTVGGVRSLRVERDALTLRRLAVGLRRRPPDTAPNLEVRVAVPLHDLLAGVRILKDELDEPVDGDARGRVPVNDLDGEVEEVEL
mmetsp:Transcript_41376/g.128606  ORF Transcript_41376/g.128606 Transcript_41376/m.128606 type:complete len:249 (+) Transcript_41376:288-1034(+)